MSEVPKPASAKKRDSDFESDDEGMAEYRAKRLAELQKAAVSSTSEKPAESASTVQPPAPVYEFRQEALSSTSLKGRFFRCDEKQQTPLQLGWKDFFSALQLDPNFRTRINSALADLPFPAFFFECPPITKVSLEKNAPFEFVVIQSTALAGVTPEPEPFSSHIKKDMQTDNIAVFPSLGKDALLIVPCQNSAITTYTHLANFVRGAPPKQRDNFWKEVANTAMSRVTAQPTWLSTSGLGVHWLHFRLDSKPKYYQHKPYKTAL